MAKFPWTINKIWYQRAILTTLMGAIAYGIMDGYAEYHKQMADYVRSMAYRKAQEECRDYNVKLFKKNRAMLARESKRIEQDLATPTEGVP